MSSNCTTSQDVLQKRASFIQTCYNLNQEFSFATEEVRLKMLRLYNTAFYGFNTWKFNSDEVTKLGKTWNINLRITLDLPYDTHCWIVEELSEGRHFFQLLFARFLKFVRSVARNKRVEVRSLYNICKDDVRSTTGSNIRTILGRILGN